jgi:hypothetical protein
VPCTNAPWAIRSGSSISGKPSLNLPSAVVLTSVRGSHRPRGTAEQPNPARWTFFPHQLPATALRGISLRVVFMLSTKRKGALVRPVQLETPVRRRSRRLPALGQGRDNKRMGMVAVISAFAVLKEQLLRHQRSGRRTNHLRPAHRRRRRNLPGGRISNRYGRLGKFSLRFDVFLIFRFILGIAVDGVSVIVLVYCWCRVRRRENTTCRCFHGRIFDPSRRGQVGDSAVNGS